ncbi:M20/M25/M40 family metallo-hydrolase [Halorubellus sp. PRR65]|uniref:M20/M25/M40 family metallo-hydrolase n=1 Tax=Halorubellus sp. PRR65 TaxID=3098148 RepID=UPI002B25CFCA|nr:M20/M25/M40 family metallo-hydrolase [Halorubellus sp. PRR65]
MDSERWDFLEELLETPSPSGYETRGQRVWVEYAKQYADDVRTDAYGNAVAAYNEDADGPTVAFAGHGDEIGFIVRRIDDDGFVHLGRIGGTDRTVSKGQHVTIHGSDGTVPGVVGQVAIHLRDSAKDEYDEISEQVVDVGAEDREAAAELVEVGDPITFSSTVEELVGDRVAARGLDNRVGTYTAVEGLRRAAEADVDATVYAVSTVQEELGKKGAMMVTDRLDVDAALVVDVTHAGDYPKSPKEKTGDVALGDGPVVGRGSANHPVISQLARKAAADADIDVQLQAAGSYTGTDTDEFYVSSGGVPSLNVSVPNRYMHTPVEVVDTTDVEGVADLLAAFAATVEDRESFAVDV